VAFLAAAAFVGAACPRWLVILSSSMKLQIDGPWDEATVPAEVVSELRRAVLEAGRARSDRA